MPGRTNCLSTDQYISKLVGATKTVGGVRGSCLFHFSQQELSVNYTATFGQEGDGGLQTVQLLSCSWGGRNRTLYFRSRYTEG